MDLAPDFDEFCASLNARDVEYVIVGATRADSRDERHRRGDLGRGVASRDSGTLGARTVAFIGRECFVRNKTAAGRLKDLADIDALRDIPE